jgi:hypothetical protein
METFENMAQRYYLEIYPNCAGHGTAINMNGGMADRFNRACAGRTEKKTGSGFILKVQDLFGGMGGRIFDEQGSIDLGFLLNRNRSAHSSHNDPQCGPQTDIYMPDMKLTIYNR